MALSDFVLLLQDKISTLERRLVDAQATLDSLNAQKAEALDDLSSLQETIVAKTAASPVKLV